MTSIKQQIDARFRTARLDRDEATKNVIGMLKSKVQLELKAGKGAAEDDELWLPLVLRGSQFIGRFIFDGDTMLDYQIDEGR